MTHRAREQTWPLKIWRCLTRESEENIGGSIAVAQLPIDRITGKFHQESDVYAQASRLLLPPLRFPRAVPGRIDHSMRPGRSTAQMSSGLCSKG
jgi:hypothetical protein